MKLNKFLEPAATGNSLQYPKVDGRVVQFPYSEGLGNQFGELMRCVAII